MQYQLHTFAST